MDEQPPNNNQFKKPKIKWGKSKARDLLYKDLVDGNIPRQAVDEHGQSTMRLKDIFQMHPEYKLSDRGMCSLRLSNLQKMDDKCMLCAEIA
jgi:hypothetical protein